MMQTIFSFYRLFRSNIASVLTSLPVAIKQLNKFWILRNLQLDSSETFHKVEEIKRLFKPYAYMSSGGNGILPTIKIVDIMPKIT